MEQSLRRMNTVRTNMSNVEEEAKLGDYDTPLADVMEIMITFGYVILFSASFPLLPMLAVIVIAFELRVDAWKLCYLTKRPYPEESKGIGLWYDILQVMSFLGVMTNVAIVIFTTNVFDGLDNGEKWLMFVVIEHVMIALKLLIAAYTPNKSTGKIYLVMKNGTIWAYRIANERLYGKLSDVDKERKERNLEYNKPQEYVVMKSDPDKIPYYD